MKDFRGNEIRVGSTIVYPGRYGGSLWMTVARVLAFTTKDLYGRQEPALDVQIVSGSDYWAGKPRKTQIYALDRVLVLDIPAKGAK